MDNTTKKETDEMESLREDVRILRSHNDFLRVQLQVSESKLARNEKLLADLLLEKEDTCLIYKFSPN